MLQGKVVSNRMDKTVVVAVERLIKHPKYKKYYRVTKRFPAHVAAGVWSVGDRVIIQAVRPLSKTKRWAVIGKAANQ